MKIKHKKLALASMLIILFLSIGFASATENIAIDDANEGECIIDEDTNLDNIIIDSQEIGDISEIEMDSSTSSDDKNALEDADSINQEDNAPSISYTSSTRISSGTRIIVFGNTFEDIQGAIDYAKDGDEILVCSANGNGSQIIVNKSVTIKGFQNTSILDAKGLSRIFCILSDNVVIENLKLTNGFQDDRKLLSSPDGSIPMLRNDSSMDSNLLGRGGAIKWVGSNGTLIDCTLSDNIFKDDGLAYSEDGKVISWIGENGKIINSHFLNNTYQPQGVCVIYPLRSYVVDKTVHGIYYGDLDQEVHFADVALNSKPVIKLKNVSTSYRGGDIEYSFYLKANGVNFINEMVTVILDSGDDIAFNVTSDSNGLVSFKLPENLDWGPYELRVKYTDGELKSSAFSMLIVNMAPVKVSLSNVKVPYNSSKKFTVKLLHSKTKKALSFEDVILRVYTGKTYKTYKLKTDKNGKIKLDLSKMSVGEHKVVIIGNSNLDLSKTIYINISKRTTVVKLSKIHFKAKKSDNLKITITDKNTKKSLKNTKVSVKVYTGKKYKTYNLKTNKKGTIQINTKNLKKGTHKIIIGSKNKNYKISKKASIKIK